MRRPVNAKERIAARYIPEGYTVFREIPGAVVYAGPRETRENGPRIGAIAFRGSAMKSEWHYLFKNADQLNAACEKLFSGVVAHAKYQEDRKAARTHEETDTQKVKKALRAAGYAVTSVRRGTGTAYNWIEITIDDYDQYVDQNGYVQRRYGEVMRIAKIASGRQDLHDDIQTDYFCVNINVRFAKYHRCSECIISNCTEFHTPDSCARGCFYNEEMARGDRIRREKWEAEQKAKVILLPPVSDEPAPVNRYGYLNLQISEEAV